MGRKAHRSRKRNDDVGLVKNPCDRQLRSGDTLLRGDGFKFLNEFDVVRHVFIRETIPIFSHIAVFEIFVALDFASEESSPER